MKKRREKRKNSKSGNKSHLYAFFRRVYVIIRNKKSVSARYVRKLVLMAMRKSSDSASLRISRVKPDQVMKSMKRIKREKKKRLIGNWRCILIRVGRLGISYPGMLELRRRR